MKIVNVELTTEVFDKLKILAEKNRRSRRAEIAIIVEDKVKNIKLEAAQAQPNDYGKER